MKEERININGDVSIGVTVSYPEENIRVSEEVKLPAIILFMGTGKTDRDGNSKKFKTNFYKTLSDEFVKMGFVCVRYDKRGTFETEGNFNTAGFEDLVSDAMTVVRHTKSLHMVDANRVILCGHSEGCLIATKVIEKEDVAGAIMLGGAGTSLKDALLYQNKVAVKEFEHKKGLLAWLVRKQLDEKKAAQKVEGMFSKCLKTDKDRIFYGGAFLNGKWIREHGQYSSADYVKTLKNYDKKVLAVIGTADLSIDYNVLEQFEGFSHIECITPKDINHILRKIDDNNSMMTVMKQYLRLSKNPIDAGVLERITLWMNQFK